MVVEEEVKVVGVGAHKASATTLPTTVVAGSVKLVSGSMRTVIVRIRMQR